MKQQFIKIIKIAFIIIIYCYKPLIGQYPFDPRLIYDKIDTMITMRDGIKLHTEIYVPKDAVEPSAFIMLRTPYGLAQSPYGYYWRMGGQILFNELIKDRYIFVFQEERGTYGSEGEFIMMRPPNPEGIDNGTDAYDTIEWLLDNIEGHNGRVGMLGVSYSAWLAVNALIKPHPALKAVSPQGSPSNMYLLDDFGHNGALKLNSAFGYAYMMEIAEENNTFNFEIDTYDWFINLGPLSNVNNNYFYEISPTWNSFMEHPNYDEFYEELELTQYLGEVTIPTLNVAGWWDAEDFNGSMEIYQKFEDNDPSNLNMLIVGPWSHGGWQNDGTSSYGVNFGSATGMYFMENILRPWFAYHLKNIGICDIPEALIFRTGVNNWQYYEKWPPITNIESHNLYFHDSGQLTFQIPDVAGDLHYDSYVSDPTNPIPFTERPIAGFWQGSRKYWKFEDQRFNNTRSDILTWQTNILQNDITISGDIVANIFASSTGTDCDWVVKLIDVYPDDCQDTSMNGYQLMIADEIMRAKYRNSYKLPEELIPESITNFTLNLNSRNHTFLKGHRIMVKIQSSSFPLFDMNPQTFLDIPNATMSDYQSATQKIYRSTNYPSHIILPIDMSVSSLSTFDTDSNIPTSFSVNQNYPNPFNYSTNIDYSLPNESDVSIIIYDLLGNEVCQYSMPNQRLGNHSIQWDGNDANGNLVSAGIYFYKLIAGEFIQTWKMLLLK